MENEPVNSGDNMEQDSNSGNIGSWFMGIWIALLVAGLAMRLLSAAGQLWLDEIWSLHLARQMNSPLEIFSLKYDNNHILNTLFLYFVPERHSFIQIRSLSLIAGAFIIPLLAASALEKSRLEKLSAMTLGAFSFSLILYSSEARGYAPAALFALLCFYLIRKLRSSGSNRILVFFWVSVFLGFLSHLTFAYVFFAIVLWEAAWRLGNARTMFKAIRKLLKIFLIPLIFFTVFYLFFVKDITLGGGNNITPMGMVADFLAVAAGGGKSGALRVPAQTASVLILAAGLIRMRQKNSKIIFFFAGALFVFPALAAFLGSVTDFHFRYLFVCLPFAYLLAANLLTAVFKFNKTGKVVYVLAMGAFALANMNLAADLIKTGRGSYREAMQCIGENTAGKTMTIGGDHDFRNQVVLWYYSRWMPRGKNLLYIEHKDLDKSPPQWLLKIIYEQDPEPPKILKRISGPEYGLVKIFPYSGYSGWAWGLYEIASPPGGSLDTMY